jgi:hypothetical protein
VKKTRQNKNLDDLPCPHAGTPDLTRSVSGLRIGRRRPPQAAGLRDVLGGSDQLHDKISPGHLPVRHARPLNGRHYRHQRDAGGPGVLKDAVICRLFGAKG